MIKRRYHYSVPEKNRSYPAEPLNEAKRLKALASYNILDTLPEQVYDDITALAAHICDTPISLVSLVDRNRQWFKAGYGLTNKDARETPREMAFCAYAINTPDEIFQVEDAAKDDRFRNNPLVEDDPKIAFYAGAPLITPSGYAVGTLCVIDEKPRTLTEDQKDLLESLSRLVMELFEYRRLKDSMV